LFHNEETLLRASLSTYMFELWFIYQMKTQ